MDPYNSMKAVTLTLLILDTAEEIKHWQFFQGAPNCHHQHQIYFSHFCQSSNSQQYKN